MKGLRILLVEDEFFLACSLEEELRSYGCAVIGPFADVTAAAEAVGRERFDFAILDINLNGEMAYPLADALSDLGIPFLFLSGYSRSNLPERFRASPQVSKPYDPTVLMREIQRTLLKGG